jgi:capsular polysaccharide biosynthesis protein
MAAQTAEAARTARRGPPACGFAREVQRAELQLQPQPQSLQPPSRPLINQLVDNPKTASYDAPEGLEAGLAKESIP